MATYTEEEWHQVRLWRMRRDIARFTEDKDAARAFALEIFATDWEEVMQNDKVECFICKNFILYPDAIMIAPSYTGTARPHCVRCATEPLTKTCGKCKTPFTTARRSNRDWCLTCNPPRELTISELKNCVLCNQKRGSGLCDECLVKRGIEKEWLRRESTKIMTHNARAVALNLPGTLTVHEWTATLECFDWKCAYGCKSPYENLDHFIPLKMGGGTTKSNCVPACRECNRLKYQSRPDKAAFIPQDVLDQVRSYLDQFSQISQNGG